MAEALPCDDNSGRTYPGPRPQLLPPLTHSCQVGDETPGQHPVEHSPSSRCLPPRPGSLWCRLGGRLWLCSQPLVRLLVPRRLQGTSAERTRGRLSYIGCCPRRVNSGSDRGHLCRPLSHPVTTAGVYRVGEGRPAVKADSLGRQAPRRSHYNHLCLKHSARARHCLTVSRPSQWSGPPGPGHPQP